MLRTWREEAGLTQRELGSRLKKPHTYVHKVETGGRRLDPVELIRWCRGLEADPTECFAELLEVVDRTRS